MQKIFSIILAAVVVISLVIAMVACGGDEETKDTNSPVSPNEIEATDLFGLDTAEAE